MIKLPIHKITAEQATKELKRYLIVSLVVVVAAFFLFGWISIIAIGAAARCTALTYHPDIKGAPGNIRRRVYALALMCLALLEFALTIRG